MQSIDVTLEEFEQNYPRWHEGDVSTTEMVISFTHCGIGQSFDDMSDFVRELADSIAKNDGKIRITIDLR